MSMLRKMLEAFTLTDDNDKTTKKPTFFFRDELGGSGNPYMRRFFLIKTKFGSIRVHEILRSDGDRHLHDHPFDFLSIILSGGYTEITPLGETKKGPLSLIFRRATDLHRLVLGEGQTAWTLVFTSPWKRRWGFQTEHGWVDEKDYESFMGWHAKDVWSVQ